MNFFYLIPNCVNIQNHKYSAPRLISTEIDLIEVRNAHPQAYLYMFSALGIGFPFEAKNIYFMHGEDQIDLFVKGEIQIVHNLKPSEATNSPDVEMVLRPNLVILSMFINNQEKPLAIKAVTDGLEMIIGEPIQIDEAEYKKLSQTLNVVESDLQQKINWELLNISTSRNFVK